MTRKEGSTTTSNKVVVGVDGSPDSLEALEWALDYSSMSHSTVEIVTVWEWPLNVSLAPIAPAFAQAMSTEQMMDSLIRRKRADHPDIQIEGRVVQGHAASVLDDASEGAALLVIATRGHGELAGLLLGSVSEHCATHARCPVLVYRSELASPTRDQTEVLVNPVLD